eukprot:COSAG06_NODE_21225_length_765_cov_0.882883_1_plen_60_part_10
MPAAKMVALLDGTELGRLTPSDAAELGLVLVNGERRVSNGKVWHCEHNRRRNRCVECGGA